MCVCVCLREKKVVCVSVCECVRAVCLCVEKDKIDGNATLPEVCWESLSHFFPFCQFAKKHKDGWMDFSRHRLTLKIFELFFSHHF